MSATPNRLIVLDRDGVINEDSYDYIRSPDEWIPLPGSLAAIAALGRLGYRVYVATNQSGIARGLYTHDTLNEIHDKMLAAVREAGGDLEGIFYCPHGPEDDCDCRKPQPGLLHRIEQASGLSLAGCPYVGDKLADLEVARAVDARPILVRTGYGEQTLAALSSTADIEVFADLAAYVESLVESPAG